MKIHVYTHILHELRQSQLGDSLYIACNWETLFSILGDNLPNELHVGVRESFSVSDQCQNWYLRMTVNDEGDLAKYNLTKLLLKSGSLKTSFFPHARKEYDYVFYS